jgi:uncharacterized protein
MLLINASPKSSPINGLGLFAGEDIPKGTVVWRFSPALDRELTPEEFDVLAQREREYIRFYGFLSKKSGKYHLSFDNVKFTNHSATPNIASDLSAHEEIEYPLVAIRDIRSGEEILQNYGDFEEEIRF